MQAQHSINRITGENALTSFNNIELRSKYELEDYLSNIATLDELQAFFDNHKIMRQEIISITGEGGVGKSSIGNAVGKKLTACVEHLDKHVFGFYDDHPERTADIVKAYPQYVHNYPLNNNLTDEAKIERKKKAIDFHLKHTCKDSGIFFKLLLDVGSEAEKKLCQKILKMREGEIREKLLGQNVGWESSDSGEMPDINTIVNEGFALWTNIGRHSNGGIMQVTASRPDLTDLLTAKRQGIFVPKELELFLYKGKSLAEAKKRGIFVPDKLSIFLDAMEVANDAASMIRKTTLRALDYIPIKNKTIIDKTGKLSDEELRNEINTETKRVAKEVISESNKFIKLKRAQEEKKL